MSVLSCFSAVHSSDCILCARIVSLDFGDHFLAGRVRVGDILLCITNKNAHPIQVATSIEYIKKKIMGAPHTTCRLTLQRNGVRFDVNLTRGGFSQPGLSEPAAEAAVPSAPEEIIRGVLLPEPGASEAGAPSAPKASIQHDDHASSKPAPRVASNRSSNRSSAALLHTCGVGLLVAKDAKGNFFIEGVAPGGPAALSGKVWPKPSHPEP